ncbi:MAG: hypothetical protein HY235_29515 [Acidobacteria bacterium]|nr:hypothetical protein [Acidobacteriota bacterium]
MTSFLHRFRAMRENTDFLYWCLVAKTLLVLALILVLYGWGTENVVYMGF